MYFLADTRSAAALHWGRAEGIWKSYFSAGSWTSKEGWRSSEAEGRATEAAWPASGSETRASAGTYENRKFFSYSVSSYV